MAKLAPATCCDTNFDAKDCFCGTFFAPCVYGSALARTARVNKTGVDQPENILPDTPSEIGCIVLYCFIGSVVAPLTGAYIRTSTAASTDDGFLKPVCAEFCCGPCCCLPCQMNKYREAGIRTDTMM